MFHENEFSFVISPLPSVPIMQSSPTIKDDDWLIPPALTSDERGSTKHDDVPQDHISPVKNSEMNPVDLTPERVSVPVSVTPTPPASVADDSATISPPVSSSPSADTVDVLKRGQRARAPPAKFKDYVTYNANCSPDSHLAPSCSLSPSSEIVKGKIPYPLDDYVVDLIFSPSHQAFLAAVTAGTKPKRYVEAVKDGKWRYAIKNEIDAMEENETWDVVTLPPGEVAIGSQWVYHIKFNVDGSVERYKTRLVALGNKQIGGEDFNETFAHVAKIVL